MSALPCIGICLMALFSVHLASHRFLLHCGFLRRRSAWPSLVPPRPRSCGRFAPRATATRLELAARCTIWVPNHPSPAALTVLADALHARTGDLARGLGAQPVPKSSGSTDPPPLCSPDDLRVRPASQTLDLVPSALGRSPRCGGPESGICGPVPPTGTLFVTSMAPVDYHLDLAPLGVRHALSHPQIHVSRARVSVPPPTLQWPIRRPPAHIVCAFASLSASLHLPYLWQVCRRRERRHRGRWRAPQSPAEPSALAAERHSRGRARATRSSGSPAGR